VLAKIGGRAAHVGKKAFILKEKIKFEEARHMKKNNNEPHFNYESI